MPEALVLDSVTHLTTGQRGRAVYCASHGGAYAASYAAGFGIGALILNDAGIGRDRAGIAGLAVLERLGVPAAAVGHESARIGDGADGPARGRIAHVNAPARLVGVHVGMACRTALDLLAARSLAPSPPPPAMHESRFEIAPAGSGRRRIVGIDSTSLVTADDVGHIVVTGSHGGLLGGKPETAVKVEVFAAVFNDAGVGIDAAGLSRLPALDARGIAAACVSCFSACIGDARSTYGDGVISALNRTAADRGGQVGQACRDFVGVLAQR